MIVTFRKKELLHTGLCICSLFGALSVIWAGATNLYPPSKIASSTLFSQKPTWIIDAGHGGEDGGAVAKDGTAESDLNLQIARSIKDLFCFTGQSAVMIRETCEDIHTEGETIKARKASDIRNRVAIVNEIPNSVLLSIHQNSLPSSPETHGAQVFWNNQEGSESLALTVQKTLNSVINKEREKFPKRIPETIYLMKHAEAPAILIECGFLSNSQETAMLKDPLYQRKLAVAIGAGCLQAVTGEEISI